MAAIRPNAALSAIERGRPLPLYWIYGEEAYFADRMVEALRKAAVTSAPDFNYDRFEASQTSIDKVIGAAQAHPVMADRRLVLVKQADAYKAADLDRLTDYAARPLQTTVLAFVSTRKPDARRKAVKAIESAGGLIECKPIREREVGEWVTRMARDRKFGIDPAAVAVFFEYIGADLLALDQAVEKATLLAENTDRIDSELAREAVAMSRHSDVFELFDAAVEGKSAQAVGILRRLYSDGQKPVELLPGLFWQFKRLWLAAELAAEGHKRPEIARELGAPPWILDRLARQVSRFPAPRCRTVAGRFFALDRLSKGGSQFSEAHLEHLLLEIAGTTAAR